MTNAPEQRNRDNVPPLNQLYFYLTEGCNLACRHCWLAPALDRDGTRRPVLPVELFERAIREARPLGLTRVKLTGGEPLLHPRFAELLAVTRAEEVGVTIETNGVLCTPETAQAIAAAKAPFVSVSIDGADAQTHDWLRGVPGAFDKACRAVRLLAEQKLGPQIIMTLVRRNAGQIEAMMQLAEELGARSLKFNLVQPTARGEKLHADGTALPVSELVALGRRVENVLAPASKLELVFDHPPAFQRLSLLAKRDSICSILSVLGVLSTGHYALCGIGVHEPGLVFGRVGKDPIERVWRENEVLNRIRDGLPERLEGICARCLMKHRCFGSCLAQNYYRAKDLWSPFWFCELAEQAALFPSTRLAAGCGGTTDGTTEQEAG